MKLKTLTEANKIVNKIKDEDERLRLLDEVRAEGKDPNWKWCISPNPTRSVSIPNNVALAVIESEITIAKSRITALQNDLDLLV